MIDLIDVYMHGGEGLTAAFLLGQGENRVLVDCGPASSSDAVLAGLADRGVETLEWILLTHVHLDHAGGAGRVAREYPAAKVGVHRSGARHLADPSKLWAAVHDLYGDRADALWGQPEPIPAERIVEFVGGELVEFGAANVRALATPGHARHHIAWYEGTSRSVIAGDAAGMHQPSGNLWRATTPPAAFDLDQALASVEAMKAVGPERLYVSHFGAVVETPSADACLAALDAGAQTLRAWCTAIEEPWRRGLRGADLEDEVSRWLERWEGGAPRAARRLLDDTSTLSLDVGGVSGWLERRAEGDAQ